MQTAEVKGTDDQGRSRLRTIDADAHVVETERTWDYMDPSDSKYRPILVAPTKGDSKREFWVIEGKVKGLGRTVATAQDLDKLSETAGRSLSTPREAREMENIGVRLRHMDEVGVDIQVLFPTIFINQVAERPEIDVAICRGFNRWVADITKEAGDRLPWICAPPVLAMDEAVKEVAWSVEHGARGVNMRPLETGRTLTDPYFYPLYEEASRLNVPITIHIGNSNPGMNDFLTRTAGGSAFVALRLATVGCFHALIMSEVPSLFPDLRWAFVEASAQWIPYVIHDLRRRFTGVTSGKARKLSDTVMADNRFYVTCQTDDDISYILPYSGEDQLIIGTDYGHSDQSTEIESLRILKRSSEIRPEVIDKILTHNPAALYGL
jgi:predicted TIM-barrel fold metal-dependent hydrolase